MYTVYIKQILYYTMIKTPTKILSRKKNIANIKKKINKKNINKNTYYNIDFTRIIKSVKIMVIIAFIIYSHTYS